MARMNFITFNKDVNPDGTIKTMDIKNETSTTEPILISIAEFARMIGCGRTTAYSLLKDVKAVKLLSKTMIPVTEVEALVARLRKY